MNKIVEKRSVPFFNYPHVFVSQEEQLLSILQDVGRRGAYILQKDLEDFEQQLAQFVNAKYALGVANGTDALLLALRAAGIGPGDEVIFASHTYVATAAAIYFVGATPVPVDCRADHMIDPKSVSQAITSRTKAIMPTQLNGRTCEMGALQTIADENDLLIIEDAAQGLGACYKDKWAGTFGLAGTISFYPAKTLGCLGDGGAILTNDETMYEKLYQLRDHGRNQEGKVVSWGLNSRLDNLQAALLNYKLSHYKQEIARRREIAAIYQEELGALAQLHLPPGPESDPTHFDVYQNYELEATQRDELQSYLRTQGIGTLIQWGGEAVHQIEALNLPADLPYTEQMFQRCLMLPMNTSLSDEDVLYVCQQIQHFYRSEATV